MKGFFGMWSFFLVFCDILNCLSTLSFGSFSQYAHSVLSALFYLNDKILFVVKFNVWKILWFIIVADALPSTKILNPFSTGQNWKTQFLEIPVIPQNLNINN